MSRLGAIARRGGTTQRQPAPRVPPPRLTPAERARRERNRQRAEILARLGATSTEDALERVREIHAEHRERLRRQEVARDAWTAAERAEARARAERQHGALVRLRDGSIAIVRRVARMPPGAERLDAAQARAALATARRRVVVGIYGTSSPPASRQTWEALAAPLMEAA